MEATPLKVKHHDFRQGLQDGVSIALGYMPVALTFGLLAKTSGLTMIETIMMSLILYAGAAQYIALNMFVVGTSVAEMILTVFLVNIRHFLMSASLNEKVEEEVAWKKAIYAFGVTDETFSVAATKSGIVKTAYLFGLNLIAYASWNLSSGIGFVIGSALPQVLQESMMIALYAMFIGLLVPSMKGNRKVVFLAILAAIFNSIFVFTDKISSGWGIILATLLSAVIVEWVEMVKRRVESYD